MENAFLRDFIKMRQNLATPVTQKKEKEEKHLSGMSMATIIEKKPPAKVVLKYFKKKYGDDTSDSD